MNKIKLELTPRETLELYRAFISNVKPDDVISPLESKLWDSKNKANKILNLKWHE